MPNSSGDKLCPICDSPLQPGSKKCGFCGTDLSIFDMDVEEPVQPMPSAPAPKKSIDTMVREVLSAPRNEPEVPETPKTEVSDESAATAASLFSQSISDADPETEELAAVEEEVPPKAQVTEPTQEDQFACPECDARVSITASSCSNCGVIFSDEGTEVFQCPACNTLVNVAAKTCPGCGAMFVESEEEAAASVEPQQELEPPIAEVPAVSETPIVNVEVEPEDAEEPSFDEEEAPEKAAPKEKKTRSPFGWLKKRKKDDAQEEAELEQEPEPLDKHDHVEAGPLRHLKDEPQPRIHEPEFTRPTPAPKTTPMNAELKDKGKELARMVAEMKPLLSLAMQNEIEISESKQLIDDAAIAGRERQLEKALELVNTARASLMDSIDARLAETLDQLREEVQVAEELGGEVSRSKTYISEMEKAKSSGDVEAAFIYSAKVSNELLPITGRYNEAKTKLKSLKSLLSDCEMLILDTREARASFVEANKAFDSRDFDKAEMLITQTNERLNAAIPERLTEEIKNARHLLVDAKIRNVNITPMLTILKSVTNLTKSKNYSQALRELREFKEMSKKTM
ncbi:MAG: hypothetical protein KKE24_02695 [Candidatus Thermoplasmatota archaeon]|nr:hypothetical protein [Candidatus Thermoplasmatota archaeon]